jgi:hypothetical protein
MRILIPPHRTSRKASTGRYPSRSPRRRPSCRRAPRRIIFHLIVDGIALPFPLPGERRVVEHNLRAQVCRRVGAFPVNPFRGHVDLDFGKPEASGSLSLLETVSGPPRSSPFRGSLESLGTQDAPGASRTRSSVDRRVVISYEGVPPPMLFAREPGVRL